MILPYKFKLGHQQYEVRPCYTGTSKSGWVYPGVAFMEIAISNRKGVRKPKDIQLTFWHEATHAILYSMGHPLWNDEKFVTAFSKRLVQLINTAEFK
jgi:hypothetical protein